MGLGAALGGTDVVPVSTRGHSMKMRSTESRERESRGSKTLWRGQGAAPFGSPNQHAEAVCSRYQLNRAKGSREELPCGVKGQRPLGLPKKRRGSRELLLSTRFCGVSLRWLRRCTPAKCRAWIPPFQRGWSPARTRPRCTGCRGRSRSPCRNTRRTDAPAHASW